MVDSHCPYCALQCAMTMEPVGLGTADLEGRPRTASHQRIEVEGRDFPTNRGGMCRKGWTSAEVLRAPDRLTTPLVRGSDGELHPMDEARFTLLPGVLRMRRPAVAKT